MRIFNINYQVLIKLLLIKRLRQPKMLSWLKSLIHPIGVLYMKFTAFRLEVEYYLGHTSQVAHIKAVLNDRWDTAIRRIEIVDGVSHEPIYIYKSPELNPVYVKRVSEVQPKWLYTIPETEEAGIDFIVRVPYFIVFDQDEMEALVDKYCLPGKTFSIQLV